MPIFYLRRLTGKHRSAQANRHLGRVLAFVAGATNAGGFLAVNQYTSHMTGILSGMADNLAINNLGLAIIGGAALVSFVAGSAYSAILINWGRHHRTQSEFAYPLLWEALLLLCFGLMGGYLDGRQTGLGVPITVMLLCFIMGLQNAIITKISHAEIRTTHMTGIITDIGIEIGKIVYINSSTETERYKPVRANWRKIRLMGSLLASFTVGGLLGALGFKHIGYASTLPLALFLVLLVSVPLADDIRVRSRLTLSRFRTRRREAGSPGEPDSLPQKASDDPPSY
ncbi:conserved membrane protein of unknown function [Magnetospirillum gryphiswaldense MSR-1 v2]|uniref:DUF1275 domain-containing protein n=1 Tax=Magnetospirillum gryphiswaldense (strain DSM 6361 / JCM 21280 / NBRC 15271 / MSR-1) TaxID=431944 RepID=V6EVW6_MAGGM|nr:conserved membrane protein of unknown function [Magnetospirillum gryphiswaldense MSR-1 v2]